MGAHQSLSWASQTDGDSDSDKDSSQTHEHTSSRANTEIRPGDGEFGVLGQWDEEHAEDKEFENGRVQSLVDTMVLWVVLTNQEMLC